MSNQIFKKNVDKDLVLSFLEEYAEQNDKFYIFSKTSYRKAEFHNAIEPLIVKIKEYYHLSKYYYLERKLNFSKFITILRQLCKSSNISYTSRIVYVNSSYNIIYYISKES